MNIDRLRRFRWVLITVGLCAFARIALADSVWESAGESLYKDKKAIKIGDVLTVIIVESASASQSADTKAQKSSASTISWGSQRSQGVPFQDFGISGKEDVRGGGRSIRSGMLNARISVRVIEVLPNGNLVINGNRVITVNDEKQILEISGIVRPEDLSADNTVLSSLVADAQIKYAGKGAVSEKARLGFISRLLSMLRVF